MENTKFTKVKWYVSTSTNGGISVDVKVGVVYLEICEIWSGNDTHENESQYTAQLISKAPEMLEMLEEILYGLEIAELDNTDAYKKAKQLIKEATTINQ